MINYSKINEFLYEGVVDIPYCPATQVFEKLACKQERKFLFESKDVSEVYGRFSLIGFDPCLQLMGKDEFFEIEKLNDRAEPFLKNLSESDFAGALDLSFGADKIVGKIMKSKQAVNEEERSKMQNSAQVLRMMLKKFRLDQRTNLGFYGAFSYDFVRLFESIPDQLPKNDVPDFKFGLYDTFVFFDHLKERAQVIVYRESTDEIDELHEDILHALKSKPECKEDYEITDDEFLYTQGEYEAMVEVAKDLAKRGELFEVVFANILEAKFKGGAYGLYKHYSQINPSPYLFYFDFGDEQLVGASPEMMIRCEARKVNLRPISGTAKRGADPIEDHENMLGLLADEKERAELDMLIDLGRNDLARVCKPGIEISDYRFVEKYSRVMHTVTHLTGTLRDDVTSLDAYISCANAGTLTGAPKVAAMKAIEANEKVRRGYYGGAIGYLTFADEMNTGIIIRTAHIKNEKLKLQVGATLLYDSKPAKEYQETINKAQAFLDLLTKQA